jgi:hypothetical protein
MVEAVRTSVKSNNFYQTTSSINLMVEAVRTSVTSINFYQTTQSNTPQHRHLQNGGLVHHTGRPMNTHTRNFGFFPKTTEDGTTVPVVTCGTTVHEEHKLNVASEAAL